LNQKKEFGELQRVILAQKNAMSAGVGVPLLLA
jgi:hypothetical protein